LVVLNYGIITGIALDPLEKKPLYHVKPGRQILSVGSVGCNLNCGFCQNYESVRGAWPTQSITPEGLVALALDSKDRGNVGIAWTYSEPVMWYEFVQDSAALAKAQGLTTVLITNGFLEEEPWRELLKDIDAINLDLKGMRDDFYREQCGGKLEPVLRNLRIASELCHVEITTLLIEGCNTAPTELDLLFRTIGSIDPNIPLHLSRYRPAREFTLPATDPDLVRRAVREGQKYLKFVYPGNLPESWSAVTCCPECQERLVERGYQVTVNLQAQACPRCKHRLNIIIQ
jgi:pyruvate formate lyase activating enzyme